jgi:maleylacetate reductase
VSPSFTYAPLPSHVIFGPGSFDRIGEEVLRLGRDRVLILASPRLADQVARARELLGARAVGEFDGAVEHTPVQVSEQALATLRAVDADCVLAIGGGSVTGLAKALAGRADIDQIIIPTTYAGSEVTPVLGETENGVKTTRSSPNLLPESVIYDVALSIDLPADLAVESAVNAMAHAVEAFYSPDANPVIDALGARALGALRTGVQAIADRTRTVDSASELLLGAWLAGTCLGAVRMGLHHKLCHTLGGSFHLPHAPTHTVLLPHALAYNAGYAPGAVRQIARALDTDDPPGAIFDLVRSAGGPTALRELGLLEADLDRVAEIAVANPYPNPRPLDRGGIRELLDRAWRGQRPTALS